MNTYIKKLNPKKNWLAFVSWLKSITWPSFKTTVYLTMYVVAAYGILALIILGMDYVFSEGTNFILTF